MRLMPAGERPGIGRLDGVEGEIDRVIAVAMDQDRHSRRLDLGDHFLQLRAVEVRRALAFAVEIGPGLRAGFGLVRSVADDLDP